ncbi:MAG: M3 family metallopeptidase [Sphingomicrobium sp.]
MRFQRALLAAAATVASGPVFAAPAIPPILTGAPSAAAINQRCAYFVRQSQRQRTALERSTAKGGVETTLRAYDNLYRLLGDGSSEATLFREVSPTAASRTAGEKCEVRISSEYTKLSLSRAIYDQLKAVPTPADAPTALYLARTLSGFERSGVALDDAGRATAQKLSDDISELSTAFAANIPKGQRTITATAAELDGLPQDFINSHRAGADGKITLRTDSTDYVPVMTYAKSSNLRRRFQHEYFLRAYPDNDTVLRGLINKRDEFAHLVGRPSYAALNFEDRMLNTPEKVQSLLDEMSAAALPAGRRDYAKMVAVLQQMQPGATKIEPWDSNYLGPIVQKQSYGYDRQEARKYFAYDNVRDGMLKLTEDMFGVDIRPWPTPLWSKNVESYAMYDGGKLIGRFYFDSHPRDGKYEHANAITVRTGLGSQVPIGALVMNMPAGGHKTGLMEHADVVTALHEYGHLLHAIFGGQKQRWAGLSGIATESDFAEAPSQMLENWVYDYDTLKSFAVDASGKTIPRELVDQMNRARYFSIGKDDMRQLGLSNIALQYYSRPAPADLGEAASLADAKYDMIPPPPGSQMQDAFSHLSGYAAAYYTYRWSIVIADDMFTEFEKHGLRDPATADRYRRLVLERGGTKPAAELVSDFLGRPISLDAYRAKMQKDQ